MAMEFTPEFKEKYIISISRNNSTKEYITHAGLLHLAAEKGIVQNIESTIIQTPSQENDNLAVVVSKVTLNDGRTYTGIGDCDDKNCSKNIAPHKMRMAETRAEGRALRKALGITLLMAEEMASLVEVEEPITQAQVNLIGKLMKDKGITRDEGKSLFTEVTGKKTGLSDATKSEGSAFIEKLQSLSGPAENRR